MQLPSGYQFAGVRCGIKSSGNLDYSLVWSDRPAVAAGVYTQNIVVAAPVEFDRLRTPSETCRAVVVNSGNANACTGERGMRDAVRMAADVAALRSIEETDVLVMSTGIIGEFLPMDCLQRGAEQACVELAAGEDAFHRAAKAILTTDKGEKSGAVKVPIGSTESSLAGMAKGAGMIGPNMATMLATFMTDAMLRPEDAQRVLTEAVNKSFNCISVEGHTSTNDTVILLANGAQGEEPLEGEDLDAFAACLTKLCIQLAKMIPDDGEGASHLVSIRVSGAETESAARTVAKSIAASALVKTGMTGNDPNWGRIVSAAGYAGVPFDPNAVTLSMNGELIYEKGRPAAFDAQILSESMRANREICVELDLGGGAAEAQFWTSDLTVDYVRFNSDYHT